MGLGESRGMHGNMGCISSTSRLLILNFFCLNSQIWVWKAISRERATAMKSRDECD